MKNHKEQSMSQNILAEIKNTDKKMKPKWHFVLFGVVAVIGFVLAALIVLFLGSFICFILMDTGVIEAPRFGFGGIRIFLSALPWLLVLTAVLFIVFLEILLRKYTFAYKKSMVWTIIGVIVLVFFGSFIVARSSLHASLLQKAHEGTLPLAGRLYDEYEERSKQHVHLGIVPATYDDGFDLDTDRGDYRVIVTKKTRMIRYQEIMPKDFVMVIGIDENGIIQAIGVKKIIEDPRKRFIQRRKSR